MLGSKTYSGSTLPGTAMPTETEQPSGRDAQKAAVERAPSAEPQGKHFTTLAIAVLGVAYGDLGTSPLYALPACFSGVTHVAINAANVLGLLSLVLWTLVLVVSLKYITFVLRADNRGEGGIFALLTLLRPDWSQDHLRRRILLLLGLGAAAMVYADAMITPSISVLSAVEGLQLAAPHMHTYIVPITVAVLVLLFAVQRYGSERVGTAFGPVMLLWFVVIAALGVHGIVQRPDVLRAVNPWYAVQFFRDNGFMGYAALGGVFLVTTGGEALYADLGHFGTQPIRRMWFGLVLPALLLNYFGQGGMLLATHAQSGHAHPFFGLVPGWGLYPIVVLATAATCIASQGVISGVFSLTRQAIQLGQLPRLWVRQTSAEARGQIYLPTANWLLMAATIALVLTFRSSSHLAGAYGVAVNTTMAVTTLLAFTVMRERLNVSLVAAGAFLLGFLAIDLGFLGANVLKIPDGGWVPISVAIILFTVMTTWRRGSELLAQQIATDTPPLETFLGRLSAEKIERTAGTAVFFTGRLEQTPPSLQQLVRHVGTLHARVLLVTVIIEQFAKVDASERMELVKLEQNFYRLTLRYGFMQTPNVPSDLAACGKLGLELDLTQIHYFIGQVDMFVGRKKRGMSRWRDYIFTWMARNTEDITASFQIPAAQVMRVGMQIGI